MILAYLLCAALLVTPHTLAIHYGFTDTQASYQRRHYASKNTTAITIPTTLSLQTNTSANMTAASSFSSPTIVRSKSISKDESVESTDTNDPSSTPSMLPDENGTEPPARPSLSSVTPDEYDTAFTSALPTASLSSRPIVPTTISATESRPVLLAPDPSSSGANSEQATCSGLLTSSVVFITSTTLVIETITLPANASMPDPTFITPILPCINISEAQTQEGSFTTNSTSVPITLSTPFSDPNNTSVSYALLSIQNPLSTSTVLVTQKTSVVVIATSSKDVIDYTEPRQVPHISPTPISSHDQGIPVIASPSSQEHSLDTALTPTTKASQSKQRTSSTKLSHQQNSTPSPAAVVNPDNSESSSSNPEPEQNQDTYQPANINSGNPSSPDARQGNAGTSNADLTYGRQGAATLTIGNIPAILQSSNIIIGSRTINAALPTSVVVDGNLLEVDSSEIIAPGRTIALPPNPTYMTLAGQVFSIDPGEPSRLVGTGGIIPIPHSPQGSPIVIAGQTFTVNPSQIIGSRTTLDIPAVPSRPAQASPITVNGVIVSVGPSLAVIGSTTYSMFAGQTPKTVVYNGQTISIVPGALGFSGTSVAIPQRSPTTSAVTADGLIFSIGSSIAVLSGTTYRIGAGATPTIVTLGGEIVTIGPSGVILPTQTIPPLATVTPSLITAGILTLSIKPSAAIISGTTYQIGEGASSTVLTIGGEIITLGPDGVILPTQTIPPLATITPSAVTADSLTFSLEPGAVIISGTTYRIDNGATPTNLVLGTETIRIGQGGIALPTTTIYPPAQASGSRTFSDSAASFRAVWTAWCAILAAFVAVLFFL